MARIFPSQLLEASKMALTKTRQATKLNLESSSDILKMDAHLLIAVALKAENV